MTSIKTVEDLVLGVYTHASLWHRPLRAERDAVTAAAINLNLAWYTAKTSTRSIKDNPQHATFQTFAACGEECHWGGHVKFSSFPSFSLSRWIHGQWMIINYVWVLETNTGATWRVGYLRLTWVICGRNPIGIVVMVTLFDIPIMWLVMKSRTPSLGVVTSVMIPPVVLYQYLTPGSGVSTQDLAWMRGSMIAFGIIAALVMNGLVFPQYSQDIEIAQPIIPSPRTKPMCHYHEVVLKIQKILDLMTGLRKIRENIPHKETIASVLKERKEFLDNLYRSSSHLRDKHLKHLN
ncbi:uncharacterized protein EDB93DRAFT_1104264 [Suillus bovinus]|uniref:uncharacterized protein n=1 Tax=Suillus bovinus TaxID=48563 RepID=UPI001B86D327|nr:uncharacterized protein EDB93DRAFT_1104264 [Suillus bovinus]KAG2146972.1 hypothetical protein EDB93DRAFT_1104264 [Suillus bovinus]